MKSVVILREGKNFGDHFSVGTNTLIFKSMSSAKIYLKKEGYELQEQGYGNPLWVHEKKQVWADPVRVNIKRDLLKYRKKKK